MCFIVSMPTVSAGESHTFEVDIEPGEYQKIKLEEFDTKGDSLGLTLARVVATGDTSTPRSLDYYIIENQYARQYSIAPEYLLQEKALAYRMNHTDKLYSQEGLRSDVDAQMYLIVDNYWRDGDEGGDANLTAKVKINYYVDPYVPEKELPILQIFILLICLLIVIGAIIGIILWRRKEKEDPKPFAVQQGQYMVYRGMDGSVYYLNRSQYQQMSNDGSILKYEYMGHSNMVGGVPEMDRSQVSNYQPQDGPSLLMVAQPEGQYADQAYPPQEQMDNPQYQENQVAGDMPPQPVGEGYDEIAQSENAVQPDPDALITSEADSQSSPIGTVTAPQVERTEEVGSEPVEAAPEVPPEQIEGQ
ncbi:MAG: hypothetical protein KAH57_07050 [Thermoplasmata archaeon]|nr:hypothetical protein [Thermoplasmata archaeon]